jgi:hypothetical protein
MLLSTNISTLNNFPIILPFITTITFNKLIRPLTTTITLGSLPMRRSFSTTTPQVTTSQPLKSKEYERYIANCLRVLSTSPNAEPFEVFVSYPTRKRKDGQPNMLVAVVDVAVKFKNVPTYLGDPN